MTEKTADWIDETVLWPVESAPKDGSVIIVVFGDASGVDAVRFGLPPTLDPEEYEPGWWVSDWSSHSSDVTDAIGWIKPPKQIEWRDDGHLLYQDEIHLGVPKKNGETEYD